MFEAAGGGPLPKNGPTWHEIREGKLPDLPNYSKDFHALLTVSSFRILKMIGFFLIRNLGFISLVCIRNLGFFFPWSSGFIYLVRWSTLTVLGVGLTRDLFLNFFKSSPFNQKLPVVF